MFDVEKIVDKRNSPENGQKEYLVKWAGYNSSENEWINVDGLVFVSDLIEQFEK